MIPSGGDPRVREKNLEIIIDNMKQFYEEQLGHLLLTVPDTYKLGRDPERHVAEAKLLLLLLLGCAVQCSNKEDFITRIKTLNVDIQLAIVDCIKQVTDYQDIVVTQESMDNVNMGSVFTKVKKLLQEKNAYLNKLKCLQSSNVDGNGICSGNSNASANRTEDNALLGIIQDPASPERTDMSTPKKSGLTPSSMSNKHDRLFSPSSSTSKDSNSSREDVHRYAVELADWKSKVRKQRQELEEKTEALIECKEELEHNKTIISKLKEENQELLFEARAAKSYRDDLDAAVERAEKADRLEAEVARYREKLTDIEYYKSRIEELGEDNRVLVETKEMLEEQLNSARKRSEKVLELESELIKYEQMMNNMSLERVANQDKFNKVCEENAQLQRLIKTVASEVASGALSSESGEEPPDDSGASADNRLSEQLSNNAQARALKLELENRRLNSLVDSLKEQSFHESSSKVLELEKDKTMLSLKVESLTENAERLTQQNAELESICKHTFEENQKMHTRITIQQDTIDVQLKEIQMLREKVSEIEKNYETRIGKEKQRLRMLLESAEKRADNSERNAATKDRELTDLKIKQEMTAREVRERRDELESKLATLEKDKETTHKEVQKLRELIETKDVALDEAANTIDILEKKVAEFQTEIGNSAVQINRLREIERSSKELDSRAAIDREALENLQSNLVAEKLNVQQVHATLEKLGLDTETILNLPAEKMLDKISEIPEVIHRVIQHHESTKSAAGGNEAQLLSAAITEERENLQAKVAALETASEVLQSEKATLQVQVTRLESESASLASQQAALQLANSRLEANIDEITNEHHALQRLHADLNRDQKRLQALHEQLNTEYECLSGEKESLKASLRDSKNEARLLRETIERLEAKCLALQTEEEGRLVLLKSLSNLRGEHSKLKEDFRNLYTNTEILKTQYRNLQEDYRKNKLDNNRLSLRQTEMQGELSAKDERLTVLELECNKQSQNCEMLKQMNIKLDLDRRDLMDHSTALLSQYHELITHSLDDKEHYHMEEKLYADKVNHLCRQKEKLEEKIMDHYKKLESCSTKKKGLGSSLVRRVCKAGSGLFSRTNRRSSWNTNTTVLSDDNSQKSYPNDEEDEDEGGCGGGGDADEDAQQQQEDNSSGDDSQIIDSRLGHSSLRTDDPLSLGHPGTRRTVYYTDDTSPALTRTTSQEKRAETDDPSMYQQQGQGQQQPQQQQQPPQQQPPYSEPRSLLIYNKVSAVINDSSTTTAASTPKRNPDDSKNIDKDESSEKDRKTANSVWYEYGCV